MNMCGYLISFCVQYVLTDVCVCVCVLGEQKDFPHMVDAIFRHNGLGSNWNMNTAAGPCWTVSGKPL